MNNQYYYFVAGLPNFSFDSPKLPYTVEEFRAMLNDVLYPEDKALIDKYFLKYDNQNLVAFLKNQNATLNDKGTLTSQQLKEAVKVVETNIFAPEKNVPHYFVDYIRTWNEEEGEENEKRLWEDLMTSFYMDYGMKSRNSLVAKWFELNLNIGNILSAIYSRKYGMSVAETIVGNNEVAQTIRKNANARDFGLGTEVDYLEHLFRLTEEKDIYEREHKIDKLRWDWLEKNIVFDYFNIEYIFAWLCKLQILERWATLNAEEGERVFRELIADLKSEVEMPAE
jgi:hypothetical protein